MYFLNTYLCFISTNIALRMIFWGKEIGVARSRQPQYHNYSKELLAARNNLIKLRNNLLGLEGLL